MIYADLAERNSQAASKVFGAIVTRADGLEAMPSRGRPGLLPGTREIIGFGRYVLVYRIGKGEVTILRVWHSAQSRQV